MTKLSELAAQLVALKALKEAQDAALSDTNKKIAELTQITMPKLMETMGEEGYKCAAGTVFLQDELYVNVLADDRDQLHKWLKANKNKALIKEYVFPQTLKAFAKEQLEKGKPLPPFIKATIIPTARIRKAKP